MRTVMIYIISKQEWHVTLLASEEEITVFLKVICSGGFSGVTEK